MSERFQNIRFADGSLLLLLVNGLPLAESPVLNDNVYNLGRMGSAYV